MDLHDINDEIGKIAQEDVEETVSTEVFSSYQHREILPGCKPHPGDMVQAGSLAALSLPQATYPLADSLPKELITSGKLSSLQLEGVLYACQRHQFLAADGSRAGFFLGDEAGVGKGRQISGIILDNFARGRVRHLWFSISADLIVDARRDLSDIGCHVKVIDGCQQLDRETRVFGLSADFKAGIIFSTYATLVSSVQTGGAFSNAKKTRLQQIIDWCGGKDFDGCLVFDECHKAKNFVPGKETASTKVSLAVTSIQRMLPKARVVYCSATGVSDVQNMAYMERLGLWGDGAPFPSFERFLDSVHRKGLGVAEMLAMEMKSSGMYISRGLSYRQAEFVTVEIPLTKDQIRVYNRAAHVWNELRKCLGSALARTNSSNARIWSSFWGVHQRFFKQLCMGMKVPAIVKQAGTALAAGQCVVIGLQTTGEASLESERSKSGGKVKGFMSICREILLRFIDQHFPTIIEKKTSDQGPVEDDWSATAKQMLMGFAREIDLPDSPLDEIIDKLGGPDKVAEMTGRRGRIIRRRPDDPPQYEQRETDQAGDVDSLSVKERNAFMQGEKLIAIISDAASTGISLHADLRCANQKRRVHITMELPWSADKAVQQLGRSHRSNQNSGPIYKLMTTNLGGERRFAAAVARRLQSLGALTKGDRRAATGADLSEFNFDTPYGRAALKSMYLAICQKQMPPGVSFAAVAGKGKDLEEFCLKMQESLTQMGLLELESLTSSTKVPDKDARDVGKFLNRILGLCVESQNTIFNYFSQCLESHIGMARKEGRYNEGLVDITAASIQMIGKPRDILKRKTSSNIPTTHTVLLVDRGMTWERAVIRLKNNVGTHSGFYCSRRQTRNKRLYILATHKEGSTHLLKICRPNTGVSGFDEDLNDLQHKYMPIEADKAAGARCYRMHLLCGGIMTMMSLLELTIARYGPRLNLSKAQSTLKVVRVQLDNGERVVGIRYPELLIPLVEKAIRDEDMIERSKLSVPSGSQNGICVIDDGELDTTEGKSKDDLSTLNRLVEEKITAVNAKCRNKALTAPRTIKTFLTATSTCSHDDHANNGDRTTSVSSTATPVSCVTINPTSANKRTAESDIARPAKRSKQSNILSSFARQTTIQQEKRTKPMICPICSMTFELGTSNADMNKHIDNCLIE